MFPDLFLSPSSPQFTSSSWASPVFSPRLCDCSLPAFSLPLRSDPQPLGPCPVTHLLNAPSIQSPPSSLLRKRGQWREDIIPNRARGGCPGRLPGCPTGTAPEVFPKVLSSEPQVAGAPARVEIPQTQSRGQEAVLFPSAEPQTHDRMEGSGKFHTKKPVYFDQDSL